MGVFCEEAGRVAARQPKRLLSLNGILLEQFVGMTQPERVDDYVILHGSSDVSKAFI